MIMMNRRDILQALIGVPVMERAAVFAHLQPFRIFIQREERWQDVMGISNCILGKLYVVKEFPVIGLPTEVPIGSTLELPWRNNQNDISRIPAGEYRAKKREDGNLGWRIELDSIPSREFVQIHIGNFPENTVGCILLGKGRSPTNGCAITGSASAMKDLRARYGTGHPPMEIVIRDPP